jgi:hypothetical protein
MRNLILFLQVLSVRQAAQRELETAAETAVQEMAEEVGLRDTQVMVVMAKEGLGVRPQMRLEASPV